MANSRAKGNKGERVAANLFTQWTGRKFSKVPRSGGLHWQKANTIGDIVCTAEGHYFPFVVEVKNHKEINFSQLLVPNLKGVKILEFWSQVTGDAERANKFPILAMRYNGLPKDFFFIVIERKLQNLLQASLGLHMIDLNKSKMTWGKLVIYPSTEFFKLPYKETKKITKEYLKTQSNAKKEKTRTP